MIMSLRTLLFFLVSLLLASWGVQCVALSVVGDVRSDAMTPWLIGLMFLPSLWSIAYLAIFNRAAWKFVRFRPGRPLYLLLAALLPAGIAFLTLLICLHQGWGSSSYFGEADAGANILRGPWLLGSGPQGWPVFALNVVVTAIMFACLNGLAAVGEEFGWRGVLQHHLIERMGFWRGVAVLGSVWGIWHVPVNLAGYNYSDAPVWGALVAFPAELIAVSFIMAWLTIRAQSFWPAVLMHGSGNGIEEGVVSSIQLATGVAPLTAEYVQLAITICLAIACASAPPAGQPACRALVQLKCHGGAS
jgi:membrane protease YdiL (CAAX protease family)